jgi:hypothetical protein
MTTTPDEPSPDERDDKSPPTDDGEEPVGAEIGMVPGEGTTFEPEEDPGTDD